MSDLPKWPEKVCSICTPREYCSSACEIEFERERAEAAMARLRRLYNACRVGGFHPGQDRNSLICEALEEIGNLPK